MPTPVKRALIAAPLLLALVLFGAVSRAGEQGTVELVARLRTGADLSPGTVIRLQSAADATVFHEAALSNGRAAVSLSPGSEWDLSVASAGAWMLPRRITIPPPDETRVEDVDLWPAGALSGVVTFADGSKAKTLTVVVESPPRPTSPPEIPRGTKFLCPIDGEGRWSCTAPATKLDVTIRAPGMIPHYRWDVPVVANQASQLGAFRLRPGASFVAYLDGSIARSLKKPARAQLLRPVAQVASAMSARLSAAVAEATFDRRGWVQLGPVTPGSYVLEVQAEGFAPARIAPVEIYDGKETSFRKLIELRPPLDVAITIQPPTDRGGKPWRVKWARLGDFAPAGGEAVVALADERGAATIRDQSAGLFALAIADADGNSLWNDDVRIEDQRDATVTVTLDLKEVAGSVFLGDEPLPATLWFGSRDGAVRVRIDADEEGAFQGRLPRLGRWTVEVVHPETQVQSLFDVDVRSGEELTLKLPDTSLTGRVVDSTGKPVTRARIVVVGSGRSFETGANGEGEFRVRGLPSGALSVAARNLATGDSSPSASLHLQEDRTENVTLRIEPGRKVRGVVLSGGQPVVGAEILATPQDTGGLRATKSALSDLAGHFEVALPAKAGRAHITVAAPARTLQVFEVVLSSDPIVLDVAGVGGRLDIKAPADAGMALTVSRNGIRVPLPVLLSWISAHGGILGDPSQLTVPDLAPGQYQVCVGAHRCAAGTLPPGGALALAVPE